MGTGVRGHRVRLVHLTLLLDGGACHGRHGGAARRSGGHGAPNLRLAAEHEIIGPGAIIHYKSTWTDPADIEDALKEVLRDGERRAKGGYLPYHSERLRWRSRDDAKFRARLEKNGPQAVTDFYGKK